MIWRTRILRLAICATTVAAACVAASPTEACEKVDEGRRVFEESERAFTNKRYEEAARGFERAYDLACKNGALFNAGLAWNEAGDKPRAADALDRAISKGLPEESMKHARSVLDGLLASLGVLDLRGRAGSRVSVAHVRGGPVPSRVHVMPGKHSIEVTLPDGGSLRREVSVDAGARAELDLTPAAPPPELPKPPQEEQSPATTEEAGPYVPLGATALALAGASTVAAIVLGVRGLAVRDEFVEGGRTSQDLHDEAANLRIATNVCWGAAGAFAVAGTLLLVIPAVTSSDETVALRVGPTGFALSAELP